MGSCDGGQVGIYRTSDKTIQFFGQYELKSQASFPLGISALAIVEGTNNFQDSYSPGIAAVISRELGDRAAIYLQPAWINNTNPQPTELVDDNDTTVIGVGTRVRVRNSTYLVLEASPRVAGYKPGVTLDQFRYRAAGGRPPLSAQFLERPRDDAGQRRARRHRQRRLVFRIQLVAEILLTGFDPDAVDITMKTMKQSVWMAFGAAVIVAATAAACGGGSSSPTTPTPTPTPTPPAAHGRRRQPRHGDHYHRRQRRDQPLVGHDRARRPGHVRQQPQPGARHVVGSASRAHAVPRD